MGDNATNARRMYDAFSRNDFDAVLGYADPDIELVLVPFGQTFHGAEGFMGFMRGFKEAFPDLVISLTNQIESDDHVVNEFTARGTHTGPLMTPAGAIPPSGKTVDFTVCEVLKMKEGRVVSLHNYQDAASIMRQIGVA